MKGLLKVLALAFVVALCIMPVSATEETEDEVISVVVDWENVTFEYVVEMEWDYEKCKEVEKSSSWVSNSIGIGVINESTCPINVDLSFVSAEVGENVKEAIGGIFKVDGVEVSSIFLDTVENAEANQKTVNFYVTSGKLFAENSDTFVIGGITLTIHTAG